MKKLWSLLMFILLVTGTWFTVRNAFAADKPEAEEVDVKAIKNKYWAKGEESKIGVVQNRLYSKADKFSFGLMGGMIISDPWLSTLTTGGIIGYHFNEYWSLNVLGWKAFTNGSSALDQFRAQNGDVNINPARGYLGGEVAASILYGKLSLVGAKIIYYDMHFSGGAGLTFTDNGNYFTPHLGIGQRFYLNQWMSLRLDYRVMFYRETILEKVNQAELGKDQGQRNNLSNSITLGLDFLVDF